MTEEDTFKTLKRKTSFVVMCNIIIDKGLENTGIDELLEEHGWDKEDMLTLIPTLTIEKLKNS